MRFTINPIICILIFLFANTVPAVYADEGPSVESFIDTKTAHIGDRITYTIEIDTPSADAEFETPEIAVDGLEVLDWKRSIKKRPFGKEATYRISYVLSSFAPGRYTIPALDIKYALADGSKGVLKTEPAQIKIVSLLTGNEKDIRDIKPPVYQKGYFWVLFLLALILIIALLVIAMRFSKKGYMRQAPPPQKSAHQLAYEELERIRAAGYISKGMMKEYYIALSDAVRRYIENRFSIRAPEMTTEEFLYALKDSDNLNKEQKRLLREFLTSSDMVKFARYGSSPEEAEASFESAKRLIDETKREPAGRTE